MNLLTLLLLLTVSCNTKTTQKQLKNEVWESLGSGWILEINESKNYAFYDINSISCRPQKKGKLDELNKFISVKNDTLLLQKGVIIYQFKRIQKLPLLCKTKLSEKQSKNPLFNFEVFAETVKEHYAFFKLNAIDWEQLYTQQKNKLIKNSNETTLYKIIEETLEKLNDNHAYLEADDAFYKKLEETELEEELSIQDTLPEYGDFQIADMVAKHHLQENLTRDSWLIQWGKLTDSIGFIQVKAMWLYADLTIPESLIAEKGYADAYVETFYKMYEGDYIEKEVYGVAKTMNRVMNDLASMKAMVIDIRFNGGGQDAVSFEILSRFIPQKTQVATQKLRYGSKFTSTLPLFINGTENAYVKPVYVLTSAQTGSAAEAFSIATLPLKNIKCFGCASG